MTAHSWNTLRSWPRTRRLVAVASAAGIAAVLAVPTAIVPTPWFGRVVPPTWWSVPMLLITAALSGLLVASYVGGPDPLTPGVAERRRLMGGGALGFLAVGCPVCNKLVLLALGTSGALKWFAPAQPVLGLAAIALLGHALRARLRTGDVCPVRPLTPVVVRQ